MTHSICLHLFPFQSSSAMSGEANSYDPNANVPAWVNIVIPIATVVIFLAVIVVLWRTDKEVSPRTLNRIVRAPPLLSLSLSLS